MKKDASSRVKGGVVVCALVFVAWIFFGPGSDQKESAKATQCLSNLKQLATASLVYCEENNDHLPRESWMDALSAFSKGKTWGWGAGFEKDDYFTCPDVWVELKEKLGFAMNDQLVLRASKSFASPDKMVLYFETDTVARNVTANPSTQTFSRHRGRSNQVFLDGHFQKVYAK